MLKKNEIKFMKALLAHAKNNKVSFIKDKTDQYTLKDVYSMADRGYIKLLREETGSDAGSNDGSWHALP